MKIFGGFKEKYYLCSVIQYKTMEIRYEPTEGQKKRTARNQAMCERYIELAKMRPLVERCVLKRQVAKEFGMHEVTTIAILKRYGL